MTRQAGADLTAEMLKLYNQAPVKGDVIQQAGISHATIGWIRRGKQGPRISTMTRILGAMGYELRIVRK